MGGNQIGIPTYWRNKLWTEEEKGKLWIQKLDKNVRYVRGMKIDISTPKGIHEYYEALAREQRINVELGYPKEAWERKNTKIHAKNLEYQNNSLYLHRVIKYLSLY